MFPPPTESTRVQAALADFRSLLGAEHVVVDDALLEVAATATFATESRVLAILRPGTREEVREVLRVAARHGCPVHPVSGGKNWGLGSRAPVASAVLLDLGRLDRIVEHSEELAYVRVEPGVTFRQLYDFLRERRSKLFVSTTGGSPGGSVLANALERGDGSGPNGDRANHLAALEVVLTTGEVVHTGFERFAGTGLGPLHRFGVGPSVLGLFTQSNFGVVTEGTIWLAPLPRHLAVVRFTITAREGLGPAIDVLRALWLEGTLRTPVGIWNDWRVLSVAEQYPWAEAHGATPLPRELLDRRSAAWGGAAWLGLASVYAASAEQGLAAQRRVEEALGPVVSGIETEFRSGEPASGYELFESHDPGACFLQGIPHEQSLRSVYWRKRSPAPEHPDPDRDRCGVMWLCPTLPLVGADVVRASELTERVMEEHGFEPLVAIMSQSPRFAMLLPMLVYDREVAGEDARARACHDALAISLGDLGYLPHRLGNASMEALPAPRDDFAAVHQRLKRLFDPADVLSPGRYDFRQHWPKP